VPQEPNADSPLASKAELINPRRAPGTPLSSRDGHLGIRRRVHHRRLYEACGDIPPVELETASYRQKDRLAEAAPSQP